MRLKNKIIFIISILTLFTIAFFIINIILSPIKVEAYRVVEQDVINTVVSSGKVVPNKTIDIKSPITGKIENVLIAENDRIKEKDILISFEKDEALNRLNEAIASKNVLQISMEELYGPILQDALEKFNIAELEKQKIEEDLKIARELLKKGAISKQQYDNTLNNYEKIISNYNLAKINLSAIRNNGVKEKELKAKMEQADITLENANLFLGKHDIIAPFEGSIADLYVKKGEYVTSGSTLLKIEDRSNYYIDITVDEKELENLKLGQKAIISPQAYPDLKLEGKVYDIAPLVDEERGTVEIKVQINNPPKDLKTGLTTSVEIITDSLSSAIVIPNKYLFEENGINYVFLLNNGIATKREIKENFISYDMAILENGLKKDDIILNPAEIKEGIKVSPVIEE